MPAPPLRKGRITIVRTRQFKYFMFNPNDVQQGHGWGWAQQSPIGHSAAIKGGGSGADRTISLTLRLDGDRGRSENRGKEGRVEMEWDQGTRMREHDAALAQFAKISLDVQPDIDWYISLTYPEDGEGAEVARRTPPRFILTLGTAFPGVLCICNSVDVNYLQWTRHGEPVRAEVTLSLSRVEPKTRTFGDVSANAYVDGSEESGSAAPSLLGQLED